MDKDQNRVAALRTLLVDLELNRVDLVKAGCNSRADILLVKGKEHKEMPKELSALLDALKPEQADIFKSYIGDLEAKLAKAAEAPAAQVEKSAEPPVAPQEEVLKGASKEVIEYVEKMRKDLDAIVAREQAQLVEKRFEIVKALPCEEAELKEVLKTVSPKVFSLLEKAAQAVEKQVLTAKGKDTAGEFLQGADAAYSALEKSAKALMSENSAITFETAFNEVCVSNPSLYAQYVKEVM